MLLRKLRRFGHIEPEITGDFCVFLNYSDRYTEKFKQRSFLQIACFDPGVINTGCRIERRYFNTDASGFSKIETVYQNRIQTAPKAKPKSQSKAEKSKAKSPESIPKPKVRPKGKRRGKGTRVKKESRIVEMTKEQHYYTNMSRVIFCLREDLKECDYILIEAQLSRNPEACRVSQHIISTIMAVVNDCCVLDCNGLASTRPLIVEVAPHFKSRYFGVKGLKGQDLKKWAIVKAFSLLERNNDTVAMETIKKDRKKDDQCDVILYCEAWGNIILDRTKADLVKQKAEGELSDSFSDNSSDNSDSD